MLVPLLIIYVAWEPGNGFNTRVLLWYGSIGLLLSIFILIHELGHALAAKSQGVRAERIIIFPLGGGAYIPEQPSRLIGEILVYAAGPLANLLVALCTLIGFLQLPDGWLILRNYFQPATNTVLNPSFGQQLIAISILTNFLLALGNLLPAYPLDGGRILRALLRRPLGERKATVVVTSLGLVIGTLLIVVGYRVGDPLLAAGALFIVGLSALEYRNGWQRRRLAAAALAAVVRPAEQVPAILTPATSVAEAARLFTHTNWPVLPVHTPAGSLLGFVALEYLQLKQAPETAALTEYMEADFVTATPYENLLVVTERIVDADVYGAAVQTTADQISGYVFTADVILLLERRYQRWWPSRK